MWETPDLDQIYRLTYDGSVADEHGFVAMGGQADQISEALEQRFTDGMSLEAALGLAVELLGLDPNGGTPRALTGAQLEVAVLDRARPRRKFRRITGPALERMLGDGSADDGGSGTDDEPAPEHVPPTSLAGGSHEPADEPPPTGPTPPRPGDSPL